MIHSCDILDHLYYRLRIWSSPSGNPLCLGTLFPKHLFIRAGSAKGPGPVNWCPEQRRGTVRNSEGRLKG